jgi:predicted TIM-barrel fold metal-dependent hydrolase
MKAGRFVVDTHVHAQRFAAGQALARREASDEHRGRPAGGSSGREWGALWEELFGLEPYDNTARLEYDMQCYGVDMCVLLPAFGMTDELNLEIVARSPERYVAACGATDYLRRCRTGEVEWSIDGVCAELDRLLASGKFVAIGESLPYMPVPYGPERLVSRTEAVENMLRIAEVANRHGVPLRYHTGVPMGYTTPYSYARLGPANFNPLWAHDIAAAYPNLVLIFDHGGLQAWWWERFYEECLNVVAAHDNVYVECGLWWRELYERPLSDPNIGPEKLLWGTDWGASMQIYTQVGRTPPSYPVQLRKEGIVHHQVDYWGWSLKEVCSLRIAQDDLNLILGGNAARIFGLKVPHTRMFAPPSENVGRQEGLRREWRSAATQWRGQGTDSGQ